ncbi:hypothetical protein DCC81_11945 [Chitinophaga parva]|uniref:Uncharacterized protein n=1 Tax=Chitinophaga parva TaxID=2169414 RepID=A0A2T7BFG2_9BACT|nr:hypothetical protein [Chitinophaga parva]PUZ25019.1 hypothetical protein DCC81_11945 [Chitinophaga parva]
MSFKKAHQSIQKSIWQYAKNDYVGGLLRALISAAAKNTRIRAQDMGSEPGKKRTLKINYLPPKCSDSGSCSDNICEGGVKQIPQQTYLTLSQCVSSDVLLIALEDLRDLDDLGANEWAMANIWASLQEVRGKLETALMALLIAKRGVQPDGSASKLVNLIDPTTGQLRPMGMWDVERAYVDAQLSTPYVVGSAPLYNIEKLLEIGAINSLGQDISKVKGTDQWYYDKHINGAIGNDTENLITFDPQLIKFLPFNFNVGRFATDLKGLVPEQMFKSGPDWLKSTIPDPATGLLWDLNIIYDKCEEVWRIQWKLNFDLFTMPLDVCAIQGMNGIMQFTTCPPAPVTCPEDGVPSGGTIAAKIYQYDPGFTYPLTVNDFTIDGNTFRPQVVLASDTDMLNMFKSFAGDGFSLSGAYIQYSGYSARAGLINSTAYAFTPTT